MAKATICDNCGKQGPEDGAPGWLHIESHGNIFTYALNPIDIHVCSFGCAIEFLERRGREDGTKV
jgi:hypothetical protein